MRRAWQAIGRYLRMPLLPWRGRDPWLGFLASIATAMAIAVLLVHVLAPTGLSFSELAVHVITLTAGFTAGFGVAAWLIIGLSRRASTCAAPGRRTVGQFWVISGCGFVLGALVAGIIERFGPLSEVADKAASMHGTSMLVRVLPIWIIWTLFMVRAEVLKSYEARFATLDQRKPGTRHPLRASVRRTITVESGKESHELAVDEIISVTAEQNYCCFEMSGRRDPVRLLLRSTLHAVRERLPRSEFLQVHRSHLVNRAYVEQIERRGRGFFVVLRDRDDRIPISRHRLEQVLADLEQGRPGPTAGIRGQCP